MSDPNTLLDQSIRLSVESVLLQLGAKASLQPPQPPAGVVVVRPGDSLLSKLEEAPPGAIVVVSPDVVTQADITLSRPVTLVGAQITGLIDGVAPDVTLLGCAITGSRPEGAIVATGDRTTIRKCQLRGSSTGQHRGVYVRSADVTITDCQITHCYKTGQEAQAIAGWSGVANLLVENCLLEGAGENFIMGGADSSSESAVPHHITVRNCHLRKPLEWRNAGYVVKNLLELKAAKHVLIEGCTLENVWVEGQTGFALVITPRNQDGHAPWSTVEDVVFRNNIVRHMAAGIQLLGTDYTYPSGTLKRLTIEGNTFEDISAQWGSNGRILQTSHGGEDIVLRNNRFSGNGWDVNSFLTFEGAPLVRFVYEGNDALEGWYGIKASDTAIGTPTLDKYAPGYVWSNNIVRRTVPENNYPYPDGTSVVAGSAGQRTR